MSSAPHLRLNSTFDPSKRLSNHFSCPLCSFQLHANCRALHEYTLGEKKKAARGEGPGFNGELNNFQAPQLSSLAKLVSVFLVLFIICLPLASC